MVDTETVAVSGNGTYSTPTGYTLPTTGTVTGTYQWDASYSGDGNNNAVSDNNNANEQVTVSAASPRSARRPVRPGHAGHDGGDAERHGGLAGGYNETGTITFTLMLGSDAGGHDERLGDRQRHLHAGQLHAAHDGHGDRDLPVGRQLQRRRQQQPGRGQHRRGGADGRQQGQPDAQHDPQLDQRHAEQPHAAGLKDTAALAGGYNETGNITFTLYHGGTVVDTETAAVSGNGTYSTPTGYTLPTTGTVTGTYQWDASYSGDGNNNAVSDNNNANEQVTVGLASPTLGTTPSAAVTLGTTAPTLRDTAVLAGGYNETGTITFTLMLGATQVDTNSDR